MYRPSTTPPPKHTRIKAARRGQTAQPAAGRPSVVRPAGARTPVTVTLQFMPGAEPWIRITREGVVTKMPGDVLAFELILWLNGWEQGR